MSYIGGPNLTAALKGRQLEESKRALESQLELIKLKVERVNSTRIPLAKLSEIEEGAGVTFTDYALQPAVLFKTGERSCIARSAVCTHLGCTVQSNLVDGRIYCPCHQSYFDLAKGVPLSGPATLPLAQEPIEIDGDTVFLVKQQSPIKIGPGQIPMLPL
jgi:Rieske Fe-S protein